MGSLCCKKTKERDQAMLELERKLLSFSSYNEVKTEITDVGVIVEVSSASDRKVGYS